MNVHGYNEYGSISITLNGVRMDVPDDMANGHRQMIAEWEALGNTIPAYVSPPVTDQPISKRQIVAALIVGASVTDPDAFIDGAISVISNPVQRALALNDWRNAPYYARGHALFNDADLLAAINLTSTDIDQLWALAVTMPR